MSNRLISAAVILASAMCSCIKDEEANIEVDILEISSPTESILNVSYNSGDIDVYAVPGTDITDLTLDYKISQGATISPDPNGVSDYSSPKEFTVTSEDLQWKKNYTVTVRFGDIPLHFGFELWRQPDNKRYRIPYEYSESGASAMNIWACGNEAFNFLTNKEDDYTVFPTQPTTTAYEGSYAAKLMTTLTGQIDKPIASGNLFIGNFDASKRNPLESTQFGLPFGRQPLSLTGAYRYTSGGNTLISGEPDRGKIQAVLYRTDSNVRHLDGTNISTSPNVVARAILDMIGATPGDDFVTFDIPFAYYSEYDENVASRGQYNLAVIFAASRNGDSYDGAPGSTLIVDDIDIICK